MALISQGFVHHINNNPEKMRKYFVGFIEKRALTVADDRINIENPASPWEEIFSGLISTNFSM